MLGSEPQECVEMLGLREDTVIWLVIHLLRGKAALRSKFEDA